MARRHDAAPARRSPPGRRSPATQPSRLALLHDLHVHQEELQAQNQQLLAAQADLEETRDRFIELYDFAPNGYLTVDSNGLVLEINLTGAALLGISRERILGILIIEDDGRGFRVGAASRPRPGLGLIGMQERAALSNGQLQIESSPGRGTTVFLEVSLGSPEPPVDSASSTGPASRSAPARPAPRARRPRPHR